MLRPDFHRKGIRALVQQGGRRGRVGRQARMRLGSAGW